MFFTIFTYIELVLLTCTFWFSSYLYHPIPYKSMTSFYWSLSHKNTTQGGRRSGFTESDWTCRDRSESQQVVFPFSRFCESGTLKLRKRRTALRCKRGWIRLKGLASPRSPLDRLHFTTRYSYTNPLNCIKTASPSTFVRGLQWLGVSDCLVLF